MQWEGSRFFSTQLWHNWECTKWNISLLGTPAAALCTSSCAHWSSPLRTEIQEACWWSHACHQWLQWHREMQIFGDNSLRFPSVSQGKAKKYVSAANSGKQFPLAHQCMWNSMIEWSQICRKEDHIFLCEPRNGATSEPDLAGVLAAFLYLECMHHLHEVIIISQTFET